MIYLILAVASSAAISIAMRASEKHVKNELAMFMSNYLVCMALSFGFMENKTHFFSSVSSSGLTILLGGLSGVMFLANFLFYKYNMKQNGVVMSATFMKLGLLVPMAVSIFAFGEQPEALQLVGFVLAVAAIVLINRNQDGGAVRSGGSLLLLLLCGGCGDVMAKIFEELGEKELEKQFLFYTFVFSLVLCFVLMLRKKQFPGVPEALFGALIGIPNFFSVKFLLRSLESVPAVIAYPTYSVATLLVITLVGVLVFREKLEKRQWFALGIILLALALLNI